MSQMFNVKLRVGLKIDQEAETYLLTEYYCFFSNFWRFKIL